MRAHVDDGALEARIAHDRHGDQQPAVQITVAGRIVAKAGGFAANGLRCLAFRAHPQRPLLLVAYPDIGLGFCQSSFRHHSAADHTQFNGLRRNLPVKTSHDRDGSPARRARRRRLIFRVSDVGGSRRGCLAVATLTRILRSGCWRDRAAARCCSAALLSSCSRVGRPIGGRPGDSGVPPRFDSRSWTMSSGDSDVPRRQSSTTARRTFDRPSTDQIGLPLRIVAKAGRQAGDAARRDHQRGLRVSCIPVEANAERGSQNVALDRGQPTWRAALHRRPKAANIGDPDP